jgi:transcriptional regulator NrdR family protein
MKCPKCLNAAAVYDSRPVTQTRRFTALRDPVYDNAQYRRRECSDCGYRWNTFEVTGNDLEALIRRTNQFLEIVLKLEELLPPGLERTAKIEYDVSKRKP